MRSFDLAPLYRATVGFDQMADLMDRVLADTGTATTYPPYNIEKIADDGWRISIAVAGFGEDDLSVEVRENALIVSAKKAKDEGDRKYLHRGIANRAFERRFTLADHVRVTGASHRSRTTKPGSQPVSENPIQTSITAARAATACTAARAPATVV